MFKVAPRVDQAKALQNIIEDEVMKTNMKHNISYQLKHQQSVRIFFSYIHIKDLLHTQHALAVDLPKEIRRAV